MRRKTNLALHYGLLGLSYLSLGVSLVALFAILIYIAINGGAHLSADFLFGEYTSKNISILPALLGTLELVLFSLLFAFPLGLASAIFLSEYARSEKWYVVVIRVCFETLSGIPSIVYGLFGYLVFTVSLGWNYSIIGGSLTLAIMILPLIVRGCEETLRSVPQNLRQGSYALGTNKVKTIFRVVLPSCVPGIVTSLLLSVGRVLSESAVLILTIGMVTNKIPTTPNSSGTSLALDIYYFANFGHIDEAFATAFVLLLLILLFNGASLIVSKVYQKKKGLV
jgi:phosphate transport system permease protein